MLSGLWCQSGGYPGRPGPSYRSRASGARLSQRVTVGERGESEYHIITDSGKMDRNSPLMQALRTEHGANIDRDNTEGEMTAVMSYDQVSYLLTVMVTVSVVSILILIFSVTLILGFLW